MKVWHLGEFLGPHSNQGLLGSVRRLALRLETSSGTSWGQSPLLPADEF